MSTIEIHSTEFLELLKIRDSETLQSLVSAHTEPLYRGALGLGFKPVDARELVQSVWTVFLGKTDEFEGRSQVRTYLFGILYNKAREMRREHQKQNQMDPIEELVESRFQEDGRWIKPPMDPESFSLASETLEWIEKCIDRLPINQRMAFCLREIEEEETDTICNILKVTSTNLGVILYRAKNKLRECVEKKAANFR
jgi:RNA polymerase sigma-70 factor, ECF subfamily